MLKDQIKSLVLRFIQVVGKKNGRDFSTCLQLSF